MLDFTYAVAPCGAANETNVCGACLNALVRPIIRNGVGYSNATELHSCLQLHSLEALSLGISALTLVHALNCTPSDFIQPAPPPYNATALETDFAIFIYSGATRGAARLALAVAAITAAALAM